MNVWYSASRSVFLPGSKYFNSSLGSWRTSWTIKHSPCVHKETACKPHKQKVQDLHTSSPLCVSGFADLVVHITFMLVVWYSNAHTLTRSGSGVYKSGLCDGRWLCFCNRIVLFCLIVFYIFLFLHIADKFNMRDLSWYWLTSWTW